MCCRPACGRERRRTTRPPSCESCQLCRAALPLLLLLATAALSVVQLPCESSQLHTLLCSPLHVLSHLPLPLHVIRSGVLRHARRPLLLL